MPLRDKTGPEGKGPLTGRGLGPCGDKEGVVVSRSFGKGMGRGMGRRFQAKVLTEKELG